MMQNNIKTKEKVNWFITLSMICCALIIWFTCSNNPNMTSRVFTGSFIILLFYFLKYTFSKFESMNSKDSLLFAIILISLFNVLLSILLSKKTLNFEILKNYIIFLSTNIFFRLAMDIKINKKTSNIIFGFGLVISAIYIYCKRAYPQVYNAFGFNGLSLNFSNPNLAGMFLFLTLLYTFLGFFYYKNYIMKFICVVLSFTNSSMLLETEARNPILAFVLFLVIFILSVFKENINFTKGFNFLVNIAPSAFVLLYLTLIDSIVEKGWLDFWVSAGKNLNSRVYIWTNFLTKLNNMWLTGDYANLDGNAHNSHMVVLCSFGIVILILTIAFTYKITSELSKKANNKFQIQCLAAFYASIFMGFGEGALYSGGLGLYILCGTFLALANSDLESNYIEKA